MHFKGILKGWILIFFCFFIVTAGCQKEVQAGPTAPDFTLSNMSGQRVSLEQYKGKVVLLDFWATWCPPCRMTIPVLVKLQDQYRDNGLVIFGVSVDDPRQITDKDMRRFMKMTKINYPVFRFNEKILEDYFSGQALSVPTMFIIDRNGKIRDKIVGFQPDAIKKALAAAIK